MEENLDNNIIKNEKNKLNEIFQDKYKLFTVLIFLFAVIFRLYYFSLTKDQPIWWDESEYMASAKGYAGIIDFHVGSQRLPGFPFFVSLFYRIGISNEAVMRFLVAFLPSLIAISLLYLCLTEMYSDKRIALVSALIFSVLWEHVFYSNRFQTENMALIFQFLAFLVLFKVYIKDKKFVFIGKKFALFWIALFSLLSVLMRPGNLFFIPSLALFLIVINKSKIFEKKNSILLILVGIAFLAIVYYIFFRLPREGLVSYWHPEWPITFSPFGVFYGFYQSITPPWPSILFWAFLIGSIIVLFNFYVRFEKIKKIENNENELELKSDILNALLILVIMFITIFIMRAFSFEYRWFFPFLTAMLAFTSKGFILAYDFIKNNLKLNKKIALLIVFALLLIGLYNQINRADQIIRIKLDSYVQLKEAGLWIKYNSNKNDLVFTYSQPQVAYYSERNVFPEQGTSYENRSDFEAAFAEYKPKYLVLSAFSKYYDWMQQWLEENKEKLKVSKVYGLKENPNQAIVVVYEYKGG